MKKKLKKPKIRFPEFSDDWEQRKCGDMTVELSEYDNLQSGYPLLTSSRTGLMFQNEFRDNASTDNENTLFSVVPFGKCTYRHMSDDNIFHFNINTITEKGLVSREYPVFDASDDCNLSFLIQYLNSSPEFIKFCTQRKLGGTRTRLYYKNLCDYRFFAPDKAEQDKIASYLESIDNLITLHQRKLDVIKEYKKGMLQKMFPKKGETVPQVRFPGFTDDWEQRKLGEMGKTFTGLSGKTKEDFGHGDAKFITYMNVFTNPIADLSMTESVEIDQKQNNVKLGDVFFTTSSETPEEVGMSSVMPENIDNIYLNSFCFGYRPDVKFDLNYLAYVLRAESFRKSMTFLAQGISRYNISKNKVMEVEIPVPKIEEQIKVGEYFRNLDNLITLHQRKLDETKEYKKGLLQKMFV